MSNLLYDIAKNELDDFNKQNRDTTFLWTPEKADEFSRVPVDDLLFGEYFLNLNDDYGRKTIYPFWIDLIHELWEERQKRTINLVILEMAIGSGKSFNASVLLWLQWFELITKYGPDPRTFFRLEKNSKIAFICLSKTAEQSRKITFDYVASRFKSGFNKDYFPHNPKVKTELQIRHSNMLIFPGTSSHASALGYNVYGANIDEASNLTVVEDSKQAEMGEVYDPAESMYNAIYQRMTSRFVNPNTGDIPGFICMMSSPVYPDDFMERKIREAEDGIAKDVFWKRAKLWQSKPKWYFPKGEKFLFDIDNLEIVTKEQVEELKKDPKVDIERRIEEIPIELEQKYRSDPDRAVRDFSCIPTESVSPFFRNKEKILEAFNVNLINPINEETMRFLNSFECPEENPPNRYMHIDLAKSGDAVGISMCHVSGMKTLDRTNIFTKEILNEELDLPVVTFDFIGRLQGDKSNEIILSDVRELVYELRNRGFYIHLITFDQWQSLDSKQTLKDAGFKIGELSIDRTYSKVIVDYSREPDFVKNVSTEKNYIAPMTDLRAAIYEGRVQFPDHDFLKKEFFWAEYDSKKIKVDHRRGKSIDVLQSVAGSFFNCVNNEFYSDYSGIDENTKSLDGDSVGDDFYRNLEGMDYTNGIDPYYNVHSIDHTFESGDDFERFS